MAHANPIFLSLLSGAALLVGLAPGCSNNNNQTQSAAIIWQVTPGTSSATCGAVLDQFQIGNPESNPIVIAADGSTYNGVPITVNCDVAATAGGYNVVANAQYGTPGH